MRSACLAPALLLIATACDDENLSRVRASLELPDTIDFGDVQVGIRKTIQLEIKNAGGGRASIRSVNPEAATFTTDSYEFHAPAREFVVQPSEVYALELAFRPFAAAEEPYQSKITLVMDDEEITVVLRGRGIESGLIVVPDPVDFGAVLVGSTKKMDVVVTNALSERVRLTARTEAGHVEVEESGGGNRFRIEADVGIDGLLLELDPGASTTLSAEYTPIVADQPDRGRFYLSNCDSNLCEISVDLKGLGSSFALACTPAVLDFGTVHPGVTKRSASTCQNVAGTSIFVEEVKEISSTASEYALVIPSLPLELAAGASVDIAVDYTPTQTTYDTGATPTGAIQISSSDARGISLDDVQIALTGRAGGSSIEVLPRVLDFGMIALGTTHTKRVLVTNNGYDDLVIGSIDPDVATTGAFTADPTSLIVPSGASDVVEVTFSPQLEGPVSSTLIFSTNDATNPTVDVMLFGTGVDLPPCAHTVTPAMLSFGAVTVGNRPELSVSIQNVGTDDCLLNDITFVDPAFGPNAFDLVNGPQTGIILPPGMSHDVRVRYTPTNANSDRAKIGYYVNDPRDSNPEIQVFGVGESTLALGCPPPVTTAVGTPVVLTATPQVVGAVVTGYDWTIGAAPTGGIGTPNQWNPDPPDAASETFLPFIVGTYDIMVSVFDDLGRTAQCTTQVTAQGEGLVVTLTWNGTGDVDLHVHNQNPTPWFGQTDDCYYANRTPLWDPLQAGSQGPNPELDFDNVISNGPENTRVSTVVIGQPYTIAVHNYSSAAGRVATLDVFCGGVTMPTYSATSNPLQGTSGGQCTANDFWKVATVTFTSQSQCTVTPINTYTTGTDACMTF